MITILCVLIGGILLQSVCIFYHSWRRMIKWHVFPVAASYLIVSVVTAEGIFSNRLRGDMWQSMACIFAYVLGNVGLFTMMADNWRRTQ